MDLSSTVSDTASDSQGQPIGAGVTAPDRAPNLQRERRLVALRRVLVSIWVAALAVTVVRSGVPTDKYLILVWAGTGLAAASAGRRRLSTILVDWSLFGVSLLAWELSRGAADSLGRATLWTPQIDFDRALFGGRSLNVVLQEHLKHATAQWWEAFVALTYLSFFVTPYIVAGFLWLRGRRTYWSFTGRYICIGLLSVVCFVVAPSAPPWAAARCSAAQVASHPDNPPCMSHRATAADGLFGPMTMKHPPAHPYVEPISPRGLTRLHLTRAASVLIKGQASVNRVAAIPSLHAAESLLIAIFLWRRVRRYWRIALAAYPLMMAFTLMFTGEHYLLDILAGWTLTTLVCVGFTVLERRRAAKTSGVRPIP